MVYVGDYIDEQVNYVDEHLVIGDFFKYLDDSVSKDFVLLPP